MFKNLLLLDHKHHFQGEFLVLDPNKAVLVTKSLKIKEKKILLAHKIISRLINHQKHCKEEAKVKKDLLLIVQCPVVTIS